MYSPYKNIILKLFYYYKNCTIVIEATVIVHVYPLEWRCEPWCCMVSQCRLEMGHELQSSMYNV